MVVEEAAEEAPKPAKGLGDEIARLAAHLDAATHRLLTCIREFDSSGEWERQGALSCAHWLAWRIGLDPGAARERVRVARALGGLPLLNDGLRQGLLSYAKVRALTRVATPLNEATLFEIARSSTGAQLERICRGVRRVVDVADDGARPDDCRHVRQETLENGMVRVTAVLHPDEAAVVMNAIEQARLAANPPPNDRKLAPTKTTNTGTSTGVEHQSEATAPSTSIEHDSETTAPGTSIGANDSNEPPEAAAKRSPAIGMADALVEVAHSYLAMGTVDRAGQKEDRPAADLGGPRGQLLVHLEQDPLATDGVLMAVLDDGTRVSAETWRRLACDTTASAVRYGQEGPITGRRSRTVPVSLRLRLWARDRGCRFPGCTRRSFVHAHHIQHWAHGGLTVAENLVLLCSAHHRLVHEGGFSVRRRDDGGLCFHDPDGHALAAVPEATVIEGEAMERVEQLNAQAGLGISAETGLPNWDGDVVDYESAIQQILRADWPSTDSTGFPLVHRGASPPACQPVA